MGLKIIDATQLASPLDYNAFPSAAYTIEVDFTVNALVGTVSSNSGYLFCAENSWFRMFFSDGKLKLQINGTEEKVLEDASLYKPGKRYRLAISNNGGSPSILNFYKNDGFKITVTANRKSNSTAYFYLCGYVSGAYNLPITYHRVAVWSTARTEEQITEDFNALTGSETGLFALYKFDETSGDIVHDSTTRAWHFTNYVPGATTVWDDTTGSFDSLVVGISAKDTVECIRHRIRDVDKIEYTDDELICYINDAIAFLNAELTALRTCELLKDITIKEGDLIPSDFIRFAGIHPVIPINGAFSILDSSPSITLRYFAAKPKIKTVLDMIQFPEYYSSLLVQMASFIALNRNEFDVTQDRSINEELRKMLEAARK